MGQHSLVLEPIMMTSVNTISIKKKTNQTLKLFCLDHWQFGVV